MKRQYSKTNTAERKVDAKLHLGCGANILPDWHNMDVNGGPGVMSHDLTGKLRIQSEEVRFIFSEHFIEHISLEQTRFLFSECYRVLCRGGVMRVSTPDVRFLVREYLAGRLSEWEDMGWNPTTPCRMVNEGMRLWGHQFLYDSSELISLLHEVGFSEVLSVTWHQSRHVELRNLECRPYHGELILEAVKG